jgi:hypothetical protein
MDILQRKADNLTQSGIFLGLSGALITTQNARSRATLVFEMCKPAPAYQMGPYIVFIR